MINAEDIVWKDKNLDQKLVSNTKNGGKYNNQARILSCDRS